MESKLIIIRGNSGSGKTTIAKTIQKHLGSGTLFISQDTVRRDMLNIHDRKRNLSIDLIRQIAEYGKGKCEFVILEGILSKQRYGEMLHDLIHFYHEKVHIYYFDLSFEETVKRHNLRPKRMEFGKENICAVLVESKGLSWVDSEVLLTDDMSQEDVIELIIDQLQKILALSGQNHSAGKIKQGVSR